MQLFNCRGSAPLSLTLFKSQLYTQETEKNPKSWCRKTHKATPRRRVSAKESIEGGMYQQQASMEGGMCQQQESMEGSSGTRPAGEPQIHADKLTRPPRLPIRKRFTGGKGNIPTGLDGRGSGELPFSGYRVSNGRTEMFWR